MYIKKKTSTLASTSRVILSSRMLRGGPAACRENNIINSAKRARTNSLWARGNSYETFSIRCTPRRSLDISGVEMAVHVQRTYLISCRGNTFQTRVARLLNALVVCVCINRACPVRTTCCRRLQVSRLPDTI